MAGLLDLISGILPGGKNPYPGLLSDEQFGQYRQQQIMQGVGRAGDFLMRASMGNSGGGQRQGGGGLLDFMKMAQYQQGQQEKQGQKRAQQALTSPGRYDPDKGILWDTAPPGTDHGPSGAQTRGLLPEESEGLLSQAWPKAYGKAKMDQFFPKAQDPYTLAPGAGRYGSNNQRTAYNPPKPDKTLERLTAEATAKRRPMADELALREAGKPESYFSTTFEKEQDKLFAKQLSKEYGVVEDRARAGRDTINQLSIAKSIVARGELPSQLQQTVGNYAVSLGIPLPPGALESITDGQSFNGMMQNLVLTKMQAQKGPQTENDAKRIELTLARLGNTPEAREFLIETAIQLARRDVQERDFLSKWRTDNKTREGGAAAWRKHMGNVPLVGAHKDAPEFPMFFNEFEILMKQDNPKVTRDEIIRLWKQNYG